MKRIQLFTAAAALLVVPLFTQISEAHPRIGIGIGIGLGPYYYRPYYGGPYYYGYPYGYYAPGPIVYETAPPIIVRQPPPVVVDAPSNPQPVPGVVPSGNVSSAPTPIDGLLQRLSDPSDPVRRDAAMDLGRARSQR